MQELSACAHRGGEAVPVRWQMACLGVGLLALLLGGCGGGAPDAVASPGSSTDSSTSGRSVATAVTNNALQTACPNGGITVVSGVDKNDNGVLDTGEETSTQYVCNGSNGTSATGANALVRLQTEDPGAHCASGGKRVQAGLDTNGNGQLDDSEASSTDYVCNGSTGGNGPSSLLRISPEALGANCTYGGSKVSSGIDANANNTLEDTEIASTSYACNGSPAGLSWVNVSAASQTALPNKGYLANHASERVAITLPATASVSVGDMVRISGVGPGGWQLLPNTGQLLVGKSLGVSIDPGATWTSRTANRNWASLASSVDGSKLVTAVTNGQIYTSTDSGETWTARESIRNWRAVTSSADGAKLAAAVYNGAIYTSTDGGATWASRLATSGSRKWTSIASQADSSLVSPLDGSKLVAGVEGGYLYTSADSGATWTARMTDSSRDWISVASSADGTKLVAAEAGGLIYTSTNSGANWSASNANADQWYAVASSANGSKLVAAVSGGYLYTSADSGANWTARAIYQNWNSVASSADGSKLVATTDGGLIYTSLDSGVTWTARDSSRSWIAVTSSADGNKLAAAAYGGAIYTSVGGQFTQETTVSNPGGLLGDRYESMELQCMGAGVWAVSGSAGFFTVQ